MITVFRLLAEIEEYIRVAYLVQKLHLYVNWLFGRCAVVDFKEVTFCKLKYAGNKVTRKRVDLNI